jgi:hypothetical protein
MRVIAIIVAVGSLLLSAMSGRNETDAAISPPLSTVSVHAATPFGMKLPPLPE